MAEKRRKTLKCAVVQPIPTQSVGRELSEASGSCKKPQKAAAMDAGLVLLVDILKRKRQRRKLTLARLARRADVSIETVRQFEAYELNSVGLWDLLSIGTALGSKLTVELAPIRPKLPKTNAEILCEFDRLLKSRKSNPFIRKSPDTEHRNVIWDIVGDKERNWLFVVASNPKRKTRFAKVTDEPGGWAIAGQVFGIDAETNQIADDLAKKLLTEHRAELT